MVCKHTVKTIGHLEKVLVDCEGMQVWLKGRPEDSDVDSESTEWGDFFTQGNVWKNFEEIWGFGTGYVTGYACQAPV